MRVVRPGILATLLLAGCAAAPATAPVRIGPGSDSAVPAILEGVPPAVVVDRALVDLDSGDPARVRHARGVLLAAAPADLEPLRARARTAPPGSPSRLQALGVLAERGEPLGDWAASEVVEMTLREIQAAGEDRRALLLGMARLRQMGDSAEEALLAAGRPGGPRAALAARILALLGSPARDLSQARP